MTNAMPAAKSENLGTQRILPLKQLTIWGYSIGDLATLARVPNLPCDRAPRVDMHLADADREARPVGSSREKRQYRADEASRLAQAGRAF